MLNGNVNVKQKKERGRMSIRRTVRGLNTLIPEATAKEYNVRIVSNGTIVLRPKKEKVFFDPNEYELDDRGLPILKLNLDVIKVIKEKDKDGFTLLPPDMRGED